MRVAIIGAGFYGCYVARAIARRWRGQVSVEIFERDASPLGRAATNNQARLHLGFHYPRSPETIRQTAKGYADFMAEFGDCVSIPRYNYYAVHRDSLVTFQGYLAAMDEFGLEYAECRSESLRYFRNPESITGAIRVKEGVIDLKRIARMLTDEVGQFIRPLSLVNCIDPWQGTLVVNNRTEGPFDAIINATYVDPNLGLPRSKHFELKYEMAAMVELTAPFGQEVALTVMDGEFVSLYPCGRGLATLSSVSHTPFAHFDSVSSFEEAFADPSRSADLSHVLERIIRHGEQMLMLDRAEVSIRRLIVAPKAKLQADADGTRISAMKVEGRLISLLCGKLDAVHEVSTAVVESVSRSLDSGISEVSA